MLDMSEMAEAELLHFFQSLSPIVFSSAFLERISGPPMADKTAMSEGH
jgi:hypothetical protein